MPPHLSGAAITEIEGVEMEGRDGTQWLFERPISRREVLKRGGAAAFGLSLGGSLLAACGGGNEEEAGAPTGKPVVLWTTHTDVALQVQRQMVKTYNATGPGSRARLTAVTGDETDIAKLTAAVRGGQGPDVYLLDRFTTAQRAEQGILADLTDSMDADGGVDSFKDQYLDFAWAEMQFEDKPYGLPMETDARGLWYRKDMLQKAGVDPAELDPENGPVTVDQVREIARKVDKTDASGAYTQVGFIPWYDQGWHYTWGFTFGGDFYDEAACKVTPTNKGVVAGFEFMRDWAQEMDPKKAQAFLSTYAQCTGPYTCPAINPAQHPFIAGKLAMVVTGNWFIELLKQYAPTADVGVTYIPVPKEGDESATWAGGWSVVIPEGAKNPEGAWELIKWWAGPKGQRQYAEGAKQIPTVKELVDDDSLFQGQYRFFRDLLDVAHSRPPLPVGALYWDELTAAGEAVILGEAQPQAALEQVYQRVQPQLQEFCS
jgi:multiple sugar transport system substrate-binding protein